MQRRVLFVTGVASMAFAAAQVRADVAMSGAFGSHMVLQRGVKVPLWGTAAPGEVVTVKAAGQTKKTTAGADGAWLVRLDPLGLGDPFALTVAGTNTLRFEDVVVGDVWLCGGQSNMGMLMNSVMDTETECAAADYPSIRHLTIRHGVANEPARQVAGRWEVCTPKTVIYFTAAGYFFGRELHRTLKVPIGLISSNRGSSPAQAWTPWQAMADDATLRKEIIEPAKAACVGYDAKKAAHDKTYAKWQEAARKAKAEGKRPPPRPPMPYGPASTQYPATLYNAMIHPLTPYAIKGAVWYQGESDHRRAAQYRTLLPTMISAWRRAWGQGDFPFYIVLLANYKPVQRQPYDATWARLREAQVLTAQRVGHCDYACIIDTSGRWEIHPKNKQAAGRRLALVALAKTYGKDIVYSGPRYASMAIEGRTVRIRFTHLGSGLAVRTSPKPNAANMAKKGYAFTLGAGPVKGFAVAGADRAFVWADAGIVGDTVVVSAKAVPKPVAVRYAWADNPVCNLYNKEGLPAVPFRTDDWPADAPSDQAKP